VTDDRQTDHVTEKCVALGGIACARATPPKNLRRHDLTVGQNAPASQRLNKMFKQNCLKLMLVCLRWDGRLFRAAKVKAPLSTSLSVRRCRQITYDISPNSTTSICCGLGQR